MGCSVSSVGDFDFHYQLGGEIGHGAVATVYAAEGRNALAQPTCAVKVLNGNVRWQDGKGAWRDYFDKGWKQAAIQEAHVMKLLGQHGNCIQLYDVFVGKEVHYLVMERCGASIMDRHEEVPVATWSKHRVQGIFRDMLRAIVHVHSARVVHRDIKPENFLCGLLQESEILKLCDYGTATPLPVDRNIRLKEITGTGLYMSPEMIANEGYALETDIWSLGVVAYLLIFGCFPYMASEENSEAILLAILGGRPAPSFTVARDDFPSPHASLVDFIRALLDRSPLTRCPAGRALTFQFVVEVE